MLLIPNILFIYFLTGMARGSYKLKRDKDVILSVSLEMAFHEWHFVTVTWNKSEDYFFLYVCLLYLTPDLQLQFTIDHFTQTSCG